MAPRSSAQQVQPTKRNTRKTASTASRARRRTRSPAQARTTRISELEQVIRGLESRIAQLTNGETIRNTIHGATDQVGKAVSNATTSVSNAVGGAASHAGDMAADMLTDVAARLRNGATSVTGVAKLGTGAIQKVGSEMERRPLMTVAIALGLGFLAGMSGRRTDA